MSEWMEEKNQWGGTRRYRIGAHGEKEYETEIMTANHGRIALSDIPDANKVAHEIAERAAAQRAAMKPRKQRNCPFAIHRMSYRTSCTSECALYNGSGCSLSVSDEPPSENSKFFKCPFYGRECTASCELNHGGCSLKQLVMSITAQKG